MSAVLQVSAPDGQIVLTGARDADELHLLDVAGRRMRFVPLGERLGGSETLSLHFVEGLFIALTENGIVAIEPDGRERWRIDGTTYGWRLLSFDEGVLWLSDLPGNIFPVDPWTGEEASV